MTGALPGGRAHVTADIEVRSGYETTGGIHLKRLTLMICVSVLLAAAPCSLKAGMWYIPMAEQVPGGFDHIQLLMAHPYQFDSPVMWPFFGSDPLGPGEDWSQTFLNDKRTFAAADGPDMGDDTLYFSIWIAGDYLTDHPAFHYQAYKGQQLVVNADIYHTGPGEQNWAVTFGTWKQSSPIPPFVPGDTDRNTVVDIIDLTALAANWSTLSPGEKTWEQGDFNDDHLVDIIDLTGLAANWSTMVGSPPPVPEPTTMVVLALGAVALMRRRGGK